MRNLIAKKSFFLSTTSLYILPISLILFLVFLSMLLLLFSLYICTRECVHECVWVRLFLTNLILLCSPDSWWQKQPKQQWRWQQKRWQQRWLPQPSSVWVNECDGLLSVKFLMYHSASHSSQLRLNGRKIYLWLVSSPVRFFFAQ